MVGKQTICSYCFGYAGGFAIGSRYALLFGYQYVDIHYEVKAILKDFTNVFYASSIAVAELLFLFRIGKIELKLPLKTENDILEKILDFRIQTVMFSKQNFETYLSLQIKDNHKDMKDHLIISQAISDRITLISSDKELDFYENQKLKWIYNKR